MSRPCGTLLQPAVSSFTKVPTDAGCWTATRRLDIDQV